MALGAVAARVEGDVFQGMYFWLQAALLLRSSSHVERVTIENDHAAGVDDVSVHYSAPGANAGGRFCAADFYQVKYHVDRSSEYDCATICDPAFTNSTRSLLQRFFDAYRRLGNSDGWYRLHLVSNWRWASTDKLGPLLRQSDEGALPDSFFTSTARSELGKIRTAWQEHLNISDENFADFARRLRLDVGYVGRRSLREMLNERLINVGLKGLPVDKSQNVYDTLTQQIVMNGTNSFDRRAFLEYCRREDLLAATPPPSLPVLGIRSFVRFAERIEDECLSFVCVAQHFDGRHIRATNSWQHTVLPQVRSFLSGMAQSLRTNEHHLLLECHSSIAFLAGYELDRKSGAQVFPVQKGVSKTLWKPTTPASNSLSTWITTTSSVGGGDDVALAVSVSRDVLAHVQTFTSGSSLIGTLVDARPATGVGQGAVADANHAVSLSDTLAELIRSHRPKNGGTTHLFIAAPNAFAFFLGQHRGALGRVQLYEFDFEEERGGSYSPSILLPAN